MLNVTPDYQPIFSLLTCDNYPYYIPSIKNISYILAPFNTGETIAAESDEILCILSGTVKIDVISYSNGCNTSYAAGKNDIFFFTCGMQSYTIKEISDNCELLRICFNLYTCDEFLTNSLVLDFCEALNYPLNHRRMFVVLPMLSHFNYGDEMHTHISQIMEYRSLKNLGYAIKIQTHLLQLLFCIGKSTDNYANILKNTDVIGISSKFSSFTIMPKGCKLSISNVEIFNTNPHSKKATAKVLSRFLAHRNGIINPNDSTLNVAARHNKELNIDTIEISASVDTIYHIWLYPDENQFIPDLRPYSEGSYLRFYAKCNMQMQFGIVVYNHSIHQYINHTFNIAPSNTFLEYCVPLISMNNQNIQNSPAYKIISYIKQNYEMKISVEDIAQHIHMNASYISTIFKKEMGVSISEYILNYRLSVAKNLLISSPESPISEIAHFTGFYDSAHFSKCFKRSFGITAKQYRQEGYQAESK